MKSVLQGRPTCVAQQLRCDAIPCQEPPLIGNRMRKVGNATPRFGLVARIRAQIVAGTYDIDGKFDKALDRLFESLSSRGA